jgi:hypothetical protein
MKTKYKIGDEVLIYGICGMDKGVIKALPSEDSYYKIESRGHTYLRSEDTIYEINENYKGLNND